MEGVLEKEDRQVVVAVTTSDSETLKRPQLLGILDIFICFVLFLPVLFFPILFFPVLFFPVLFFPVLFIPVLFSLFCSSLFCSSLFCSSLFCSYLFCSSLFCYFLFWYISELLRLPCGRERHWPGVGNQHLHTADGDKHCPVCHRSRLRHHGLQQWSLRGGGSLAREAPWQSSAQNALQVGYRFWPPTVNTVNTITSCVLSFALYLHPSPLVHHLGGTE